MTGWRIGYIGAPKWIASLRKNARPVYLRNFFYCSKAAMAAVLADPKVTHEMCEAFKNAAI